MNPPTIEEILLPALKMLRDGEPLSMRQIHGRLVDAFMLDEEERGMNLTDGRQSRFYNRLGWALTWLRNAGLAMSPQRGRTQITDEGLGLLARDPAKIDRQLLNNYPGFVEALRRRTAALEVPSSNDSGPEVIPPEERIEAAVAEIQSDLIDQLLQLLKAGSPRFFEAVVRDVLVAMGYGVVDRRFTGRKGPDGGIDGLIRQDPLGLDPVCIQAKRYADAAVGRPEIQKFVGSMNAVRARKGVFFTTSRFSPDAVEYAERVEGATVVLVDGDTLANLMIKYQVGVVSRGEFQLYAVSTDYFAV